MSFLFHGFTNNKIVVNLFLYHYHLSSAFGLCGEISALGSWHRIVVVQADERDSRIIHSFHFDRIIDLFLRGVHAGHNYCCVHIQHWYRAVNNTTALAYSIGRCIGQIRHTLVGYIGVVHIPRDHR